MKYFFASFILIFFLGACDAYGVSPQTFPILTTIPSRTPIIVTATPVILTLPFTRTPAPGETLIVPVILTNSEIPTLTAISTPIPPTETSIPTFTSTAVQSVAVDILGCNTGIDITHGMGEVTNSYLTIKNPGTVEFPNTCALLRAVDENREHPDKQVCINTLPAQYQVTLKLTVDSTYKQSTAIQIDVTSNDVILLRVDKPSCTDISLFGDVPTDLGVVKPME